MYIFEMIFAIMRYSRLQHGHICGEQKILSDIVDLKHCFFTMESVERVLGNLFYVVTRCPVILFGTYLAKNFLLKWQVSVKMSK